MNRFEGFLLAVAIVLFALALASCQSAVADESSARKETLAVYGQPKPEIIVTPLEVPLNVKAKLAKERHPVSSDELLRAGLCPLQYKEEDGTPKAFKAKPFNALPEEIQAVCIKASHQWRDDLWAVRRILMKERQERLREEEGGEMATPGMVATAGG